MRHRITPLISAFLGGIPVPALASTPLGEVLFYNEYWRKTFTPFLSDAATPEQLPTSLHECLAKFNLRAEVIEEQIVRSLEDEANTEASPTTPLVRLPHIPYALSFRPVRHNGIIILLVTAIADGADSGHTAAPATKQHEYREMPEKVCKSLQAENGLLTGAIERVAVESNRYVREMGHEYRTPLNSILGLLELALLNPIPDDIRQHLLQAQVAADDLLTLVNDVVEFMDLDTRSFPLRNDTSSIENLLDRTLALAYRHTSEKGIDVFTKLAETAPKVVLTDERLLGQIIFNLLLFIIQYANPRGGIVVFAEHEINHLPREERANILRLSFGYWNENVSDDEVRRLFSTASEIGLVNSTRCILSPLRLSLARRVLERLGGGMTIRHINRRGVRLELSIPVGDASEPSEEQNSQLQTQTTGKTRILIAEDNAVNARVMALMLEYLDAQFVLVKNGSEAIEAFEKDEAGFALVLMDCQMPEIDGFEATRAIRLIEAERPRRTPIVAMTAYALPDAREACFRAGMDGFLLKPISARQISAILEEFGLASEREVPSH